MTPGMPLSKLLKGIVEADETFVGGKGDRRSMGRRKTPVVALIERGGDVSTHVVSTVSQHNLKKCLNECVSKDAILCTDEHVGYAQGCAPSDASNATATKF